MKNPKSKLAVGLCAIAFAGLSASSALAGEVTGKGKQIDSPGASFCKFSGQNDGEDPPGRTQSFGQNVSNDYLDPFGNPIDPTSLDPHSEQLQFHPGSFCNPNNFDATNIR